MYTFAHCFANNSKGAAVPFVIVPYYKTYIYSFLKKANTKQANLKTT